MPPVPISGDGHSSLDEIDQIAKQLLQDKNLPGATIAVGIGSRLVYSKALGFADVDTEQPMLPSNRTKIGSVSKLLTTAAVMKLHETPGNDFNINRRMYGSPGLFSGGAYFLAIKQVADTFGPGASHTVQNWYRQIEVRHLLSHCAGWNGSGSSAGAAALFDVPKEQVTPKQNHLWFLRNRPPIAPPGFVTKYGNRSIGVMDHVIESVSGTGYVDYVRQEILQPIGLNSVASTNDVSSALDASPHKYINRGKTLTPIALEPKPGTGSAGGWRATAVDLVKFMMAMDKLQGRPDVLHPSTVDLMERIPFQTPKPRALGWGIKVKNAGSYLGHSGSVSGGGSYVRRFTPGYIANSGADMSNVSIAVCCNVQNSSAARSLTGKIGTLVSKADVPVTYNLLQALVAG